MKGLLALIDERTAAFEKLPLYAFMADDRVAPEARLAFVPALAHFVMSFADLYGFVLRDEPARDPFQELVNAHTHEDGGHWRWFLADLAALGHDPAVRFSDALRFTFGPSTTKTRLLTYRMCRLGLGATSLQKLVLVHCIEATGRVSLRSASAVSRAVAARTGKRLVYFGPHHFETESDHTLERDDVRASLESVVVDAEMRAALRAVIDDAFDAFTAFADDLARFAQHPVAIGEAATRS